VRFLIVGNKHAANIVKVLQRTYALDVARNLEDAFSALALTPYDLIITDNLPNLKKLRDAGEERPILILTAINDALHRTECLNSGADYIISLPLIEEELLAACIALIRRTYGRGSRVIIRGPIRYIMGSGSVEKNGRTIELSARELAVLVMLLVARPGTVISRSEIEARIYDWNSGVSVTSNAVEVYISSLRRKLGHGFIRTVRRLGYTIAV
jgi:two-component system, OmpR family, response regulator QseB